MEGKVTGPKELGEVKRQLADRILHGQRLVGWSPDLPSKWWFGKIVDPRTGMPFTPSGAWDFIAEQLQDESTQIAVIDLEKPPNEKGYVLKISVTEGTIYVKLQMGRENVVIGRSFHL